MKRADISHAVTLFIFFLSAEGHISSPKIHNVHKSPMTASQCFQDPTMLQHVTARALKASKASAELFFFDIIICDFMLWLRRGLSLRRVVAEGSAAKGEGGFRWEVASIQVSFPEVTSFEAVHVFTSPIPKKMGTSIVFQQEKL